MEAIHFDGMFSDVTEDKWEINKDNLEEFIEAIGIDTYVTN